MTTTIQSFPSLWSGLQPSLPHHEFINGHCYFSDQSSSSNKNNDALGLTPLPQYGLLKIEGIDAASFLQGQLTADVDALDEGESVFGAHCNAKGRMHDNFIIHRQSPDQFVLLLPATMVEIANKALSKYAVFSKVTIHSLTESHIGLAASKPMDTLPITFGADDYRIHYGNNFDVYMFTAKTIESLASALPTVPHQWHSSTTFEQHLLSIGLGFVQPDTAGEFIPQMLNMDSNGGISFTKGCYTGQEIIARMKYRGNVKRRCYRFSCHFDATQALKGNSTPDNVMDHILNTISPGAEISDVNDANVGTVVSAINTNRAPLSLPAAVSQQWEGLVVAKIASVENGDALEIKHSIDEHLTIGISLISLPYAINN